MRRNKPTPPELRSTLISRSPGCPCLCNLSVQFCNHKRPASTSSNGAQRLQGQGDGAGKKPGLGIATHWTLHKSTGALQSSARSTPPPGTWDPARRPSMLLLRAPPRPLPTRFYQKEGTPEERSKTRFSPLSLFLFTFTPLCLTLSPSIALSAHSRLSLSLPPRPLSRPLPGDGTPAASFPRVRGPPPRPASHPLRASPPPAPPLRPRPRPQPISARPPGPAPGLSGRAPRSPGLDAEGGAAGRGRWGLAAAGRRRGARLHAGEARGCEGVRWAPRPARDGPAPSLAGPSRAEGGAQARWAGGPGTEVEVGAEEGAEPRRWVERRGGGGWAAASERSGALVQARRRRRRRLREAEAAAGPDERPEVADEAPGAPMGGCVGAQHDSSGSLSENSGGHRR